MKNQKSRIIGLMSGTSLDGLDMACVDFWQENNQIQYNFIATKCDVYPIEWKEALQKAHELTAQQLLALDAAYGNYLGQIVNKFITEFNIENIDYIASHGHTIFHQPDKGFTLQIGHGAHIQTKTRLPVICDFRSQDVALGGQGAPLVPIGDKLLFSAYQACVNLGGFANISFDIDEKRIAFDICPVNFVLNHLCQKIGKPFDFEGEIAQNSSVNSILLNELNQISYYQKPFPKSLGREWVEQEISPILEKHNIPIQEKIATFTHHAAMQISKILDAYQLEKVLFSGGGSKNDYLMYLIKIQSNSDVCVADDILVDYKEALIFGLLAYLKTHHITNVLSSVTGASRDSIGGILYK